MRFIRSGSFFLACLGTELFLIVANHDQHRHGTESEERFVKRWLGGTAGSPPLVNTWNARDFCGSCERHVTLTFDCVIPTSPGLGMPLKGYLGAFPSFTCNILGLPRMN